MTRRCTFEYLASFGATFPAIQRLVSLELNELASMYPCDLELRIPDISFITKIAASGLVEARQIAKEMLTAPLMASKMIAIAFPVNTSSPSCRVKDLVSMERQVLADLVYPTSEQKQLLCSLCNGPYPYADPRMKWFIIGYYELSRK